MSVNQGGKENYLIKKFSCGEAVVKNIQESDTLNVSDDIIRVASSFKAGIGCNGNVCGCLLAATALIGLKYGRINGEEDDVIVCEKTTEFYNKFKEKFGKLQCKNITKKFREEDIFMSDERKNFCADIVAFTSTEMEKVLVDI